MWLKICTLLTTLPLILCHLIPYNGIRYRAKVCLDASRNIPTCDLRIFDGASQSEVRTIYPVRYVVVPSSELIVSFEQYWTAGLKICGRYLVVQTYPEDWTQVLPSAYLLRYPTLEFTYGQILDIQNTIVIRATKCYPRIGLTPCEYYEIPMGPNEIEPIVTQRNDNERITEPSTELIVTEKSPDYVYDSTTENAYFTTSAVEVAETTYGLTTETALVTVATETIPETTQTTPTETTVFVHDNELYSGTTTVDELVETDRLTTVEDFIPTTVIENFREISHNRTTEQQTTDYAVVPVTETVNNVNDPEFDLDLDFYDETDDEDEVEDLPIDDQTQRRGDIRLRRSADSGMIVDSDLETSANAATTTGYIEYEINDEINGTETTTNIPSSIVTIFDAAYFRSMTDTSETSTESASPETTVQSIDYDDLTTVVRFYRNVIYKNVSDVKLVDGTAEEMELSGKLIGTIKRLRNVDTLTVVYPETTEFYTNVTTTDVEVDDSDDDFINGTSTGESLRLI